MPKRSTTNSHRKGAILWTAKKVEHQHFKTPLMRFAAMNYDLLQSYFIEKIYNILCASADRRMLRSQMNAFDWLKLL